MSKSKMFEEALADAKAISKVAFENAKLTLEEHFAPTLKKMVSSKLQESLEDEYEDDDDATTDDMSETKEKSPEEDEKESGEGKESEDEGLNLEALLRELESEDDGETEDEVDETFAEKEEPGKKGVKPMDEKQGEEDGDEDKEEIDEEKAEYLRLKEKFEGKPKSKEEVPEKEEKPEDDSEVDETIDVEALLRELEGGDEEESDDEKVNEKFGDKEEAGKNKAKPMDEKQELEKLKSEINEINLVNSKLIYFNKIVNENEITSKSDKVTLLKQFDNCKTVNEAKLVYQTLSKVKKVSKKPIVNSSKKALKESISFASKSAGTSTSKKANLKEGEEIISSDLAKRFSFLAFGK